MAGIQNLWAHCCLHDFETAKHFPVEGGHMIYRLRWMTVQSNADITVRFHCNNSHYTTGDWWTIYVPVSLPRMRECTDTVLIPTIFRRNCSLAPILHSSNLDVALRMVWFLKKFHLIPLKNVFIYFLIVPFSFGQSKVMIIPSMLKLSAFHGHTNEAIKLLGQRPQFTENNTGLLFLILLS